MALSMISAPTGSSLKVSGIRMAVPAAGPSPGSTPISVPSTQPIRANAKFCRLIAAARPARRWSNVSIAAKPLESQRADRQRHLEPIVEDVEDAKAPGCRGEQNGGGRPRAERQQQTADEEQHGQPETERLEQRRRGRQREKHAAALQQRLPIG